MSFVSVIMPAYNSATYIGTAIESILSQTHKDLELIIINDGSTDYTLKIAQAYQRRDSRVHIITQQHRGPSSSRNQGLKTAQGDYLYFMDSDDILKPTALSTCTNLANQENLDLVSFSAELLSNLPEATHLFKYQKPDYLAPLPGEDLLVNLYDARAYSCSPCLYLFSRELLYRMISWFDEGYIHEDEGFTAELYCRSSRAISLSDRLFRRRVRLGSIMTKTHSWQRVRGKVEAVLHIRSFLRSTKTLKRATKRTLHHHQRTLLREARKIAEEIRLDTNFIILMKRFFNNNDLLMGDPPMLFYVRMNKAYCISRQFWHGILTLLTKNYGR